MVMMGFPTISFSKHEPRNSGVENVSTSLMSLNPFGLSNPPFVVQQEFDSSHTTSLASAFVAAYFIFPVLVKTSLIPSVLDGIVVAVVVAVVVVVIVAVDVEVLGVVEIV